MADFLHCRAKLISNQAETGRWHFSHSFASFDVSEKKQQILKEGSKAEKIMHRALKFIGALIVNLEASLWSEFSYAIKGSQILQMTLSRTSNNMVSPI